MKFGNNLKKYNNRRYQEKERLPKKDYKVSKFMNFFV